MPIASEERATKETNPSRGGRGRDRDRDGDGDG